MGQGESDAPDGPVAGSLQVLTFIHLFLDKLILKMNIVIRLLIKIYFDRHTQPI